MKISVHQKLLLFSLLILVGIGFIGYAVHESNKKLSDSEKWVKHTQTVFNQSGEMLSLARNVENASRGFVITRDNTGQQLLLPVGNL